MSGLHAVLATPAGDEVVDALVRVRFDSHDGARAVLAGHEPAYAVLLPGVIEFVAAGGAVSFAASEGGLVCISHHAVRFVTSWAAHAADLSTLRVELAQRAAEINAAEAVAVAAARRRDLATRQAMAALERKLVHP